MNELTNSDKVNGERNEDIILGQYKMGSIDGIIFVIFLLFVYYMGFSLLGGWGQSIN